MNGRTISRADAIALAVIGLLVLMLVPTVIAQEADRNRELDHRQNCATNLRSIAQAMQVYAADNYDVFPCLPATSATTYDVALKPDEGTASAGETLKDLYKNKRYLHNPAANLWMLVLNGQVPPKIFLCPSDPFANVPAQAKAASGNFYRNFQDSKNLSYSAAYMWRIKDDEQLSLRDVPHGAVVSAQLWTNLMDASLPILSDMAPYLGKAKEGSPATRPADARPQDPVNDDWAVSKANSQNHQFEGQNVLFGDGHVTFVHLPVVGQIGDSIWGIRKSASKDGPFTEIPIEAGSLPHSLTDNMGAWDVVMVPTRDAKGNLK